MELRKYPKECTVCMSLLTLTTLLGIILLDDRIGQAHCNEEKVLGTIFTGFIWLSALLVSFMMLEEEVASRAGVYFLIGLNIGVVGQLFLPSPKVWFLYLLYAFWPGYMGMILGILEPTGGYPTDQQKKNVRQTNDTSKTKQINTEWPDYMGMILGVLKPIGGVLAGQKKTVHQTKDTGETDEIGAEGLRRRNVLKKSN